jgi:hypothetical protein
MPENLPRKAQSRGTEVAAKIVWDDSNMKSSYANVCNVASTREEFVLFFGTNQAWKGGDADVKVQLSDRIILSPHAAKRLARLLGGVLEQYEKRFGSLDATPDVPTPGASS